MKGTAHPTSVQKIPPQIPNKPIISGYPIIIPMAEKMMTSVTII